MDTVIKEQIYDPLEYERQVLGAILIEASILENIVMKLNPEDFDNFDYKNLYKCFIEMYESEIPIDLVTAQEFISKKNITFGNKGSLSGHLMYLAETSVLVTNIDYYVKKVIENSTRREFNLCCKRYDQESEYDMSPDVIENCINEFNEIKNSRNRINSKSNSLDIKSAKEIQNEYHEKVESIWGDLLYPSSIIQLNSEPGLGKTTFLYNLCYYGAQGQSFLDIYFSKKINSLYVDVETPGWKRKSKLETIIDGDFPDNLFFSNNLDLTNDYKELMKSINDKKLDLVVLDTQSRIFNLENENDNAEANGMLSILRHICNETGATIVLVHHTGKDDSKGVYSGRGASAVAAGVDIVINMTSLDKDVLKLDVVKNRLNNDYFTLQMKKIGEDQFEPFNINQEDSVFIKYQAQDEILNFDPGCYETKEIQSILQANGYSKATITRDINGLFQSGKIRKVTHGVYELYGTQLK